MDFYHIEGTRPISRKQVVLLKNSITKHTQIYPIIVTPDGGIIDGKRRLEACKSLGIDCKYQVYEGKTPVLTLARVLNESKNYSLYHTLITHNYQGKADKLMRYHEEYPEFSLRLLIVMCSKYSNSKAIRLFKDGELDFSFNPVNTLTFLRGLESLVRTDTRKIYNTSNFVKAYLKMATHKGFLPSHFKNKLAKCKQNLIIDLRRVSTIPVYYDIMTTIYGNSINFIKY